jgi:Domain of unknown function (DUF4956)
MNQFFEIFSSENTLFFSRLAVNFISSLILIRGIYFKNYKKSDHFLSFFSFNTIIFLITFSLNQVEMSMGSAFGLFAVFSVLRYRTEGLSSRDVTYLFLSIAIGLITAVSKGSVGDVALLNFIILAVVGIIESKLLLRREFSKRVVYDNPKLLAPEHKQELIVDLKSKISITVHKVEIMEIDLIRDSAVLTIFYYE